MADFLTTRGTTSQIEKIINEAKTNVVLISPYIKLPETLFQTLRNADQREVSITIVYGKKDKLDPELIGQLQQLKNVSVHFLPNLHAKCYFNEQNMVIGSLNLYDYSEQNNREMGILLDATKDVDVMRDAIKEAQVILGAAADVDFRRRGTQQFSRDESLGGHCIRCGRPITHDVAKPLCGDCFEEWAVWGNPDYEESYCHTCGKAEPTTKSRPECYSCRRKPRKWLLS